LLTQLSRNLVTNALKFTEHGSVRIAAKTEASANLLLISVADTGVCIAPEHHELVFEEFFQVPGRLQARSKNSGLGLPYARRVAEAAHVVERLSLIG
jgi:signal transduction histidine kinase